MFIGFGRRSAKRIDQLVTNASFGDAITNHCLEIRDALRSWGYESRIFAQYVDRRMAGEAVPYTEFEKAAANRTAAILHYSIGSDVAKTLARSNAPAILVYHNVTPPEYFLGINTQLADLVRRGREELPSLKASVSLALADSEFNRLDLVEAGFPNTGVLPIAVDFEKYMRPGAPTVLRAYQQGRGTKIVFVGRIAPNKRQDDIIRTFNYYKKVIDPEARLFLVGSYEGMDQYLTRLNYLVRDLGVRDVVFTGQVSLDEMIAYYRVSDAFLCMSEHEGFCVPLLEAMHFDLPIVAYKSTAVPYTLEGAGVLFTEKRYDVVAEMIDLVVNNQSLRERLLHGQRERLKHFAKENTLRTLKHWIEQVAS